jgi:hypothetical protein
MQITRIAGGTSGLSEFSEIDIACTDQTVDGFDLSLSAALESPAVRFVSVPAGFETGMHPIEERRLVFVMNGTLELGIPAGDTRRVSRGEVLLAEDTDSTGHTTRTINGPADLVFVAIGLTEIVQ